MINTLPQLATELNKIAPTRMYQFTTPQAPPFIIYLDEGEDNFHADDTVFVEGTLVTIEIYSNPRNFAKEAEIKTMLKSNDIPYERGPTIFIESEGLFLTTFTIKLMK